MTSWTPHHRAACEVPNGFWLLDSLTSFCAACGLDITLNKTKVMQFHPPRRQNQLLPMQHTFTLGAHTLDNFDTYKYLGVHFHSGGNPKHYLAAARRNLDHSYAA